jgi:transmembrane sensor
MNRYSRTPIVLVDDPVLAGLRISGLYRTGDNAGFARAVAALHNLNVSERQGRLELAKAQ